jgi:hypothetical protein
LTCIQGRQTFRSELFVQKDTHTGDELDSPASFASPASLTTAQGDSITTLESPNYYHEPYHGSQNPTNASPQSYRSQDASIATFTSPAMMNHDTPDSGATPHSQTRTEHAAANLLALRNTSLHTPTMVGVLEQLPAGEATGHLQLDTLELFDPGINNVTFDDGIFLPGSTYQELHTTLRNHIFNTARSIAPTRHGSPVSGVEYELTIQQNQQQGFVSAATELIERNQMNNISPRAPELTQHEEYELWKNWTDEVAQWVSIKIV